jgi:hypothetical protein
MTRKPGRAEAADTVVMGVEISSRRRQIEVTTMQRGSGRHTHFATMAQVPPELRGEVLLLVRGALLNAGYATLAELEAALTSELVVPDPDADAKDADAKDA